MDTNFIVLFYILIAGCIFTIQFMKIKKLEKRLLEMEELKIELYNIGDNIAVLEDKQSVYDFILNSAIKIISKGNKGSIMIQGDDGKFHFISTKGYNTEIKNVSIPKENLFLYQYNAAKDIGIIDRTKINKINKSNSNILEYIGEERKIFSVLSSPIRYNGKIIGVINIDSTIEKECFTEDDIRTMRYIRHELELAIKNFLIQDKLKYIATHDELTDLYNRRYFNNFLDITIESVRNNSEESYIAMLDLDDFKQINDMLGHNMGDRALKIVANSMRNCLGENDIYSRVAGDEFVIIFRRSTYEDVLKKLSDMKEYMRLNDEGLGINFSYGITKIEPDRSQGKDDFLSLADKDMYNQKKIKKVGR